jgi:transcriptional regulator with XRE-family HTH domain
MDFGARVKAFREKAGLSQSRLAKLIGVQQPTISHIEAGESDTSKHIFRLAQALGVHVRDLDPRIPSMPNELPQDIDDLVRQIRGLPPEDQKEVIDNLNSTLKLVRKRGKIG